MRHTRWSGVLQVLVTALVIAAAAGLWHRLPTPDDVYGPFDVNAGIGERAVGRAMVAEVGEVRIAPRIRKDRDSAPVLDALGRWVSVDAEAMTTHTDQKPNVELIIGPNTYVPTARLGVMALAGSLTPGIAVRGSWVFDVPAETLSSGVRQMTVRVWVGDGRMDSRLVIDIPLTDSRVSHRDIIVLAPETKVGV